MRAIASAAIALFAAALLGACSSDDSGDNGTGTGGDPQCSETLCEAGTTTCLGNAVATCSSDGKSYSLNACGANASCAPDGTCKARECAFLGMGVCKDNKTLSRCSTAGSLSEITCDGVCAAGACRDVQCEADSKECGWQAVGTCNSDGLNWSVEQCETGKTCGPDKTCVTQECNAGEARCKDNSTAQTCGDDLASWVDAPCAEGEVCNPDYNACVPVLCSPPVDMDAGGTDDTTEEDTVEPVDEGPKPELEPLDQAECTIDGETIVFTSNKSANYVVAMKDLRVTMDKSQHKIEISIAGIEEFDIGTWSSEVASEEEIRIFYHDGSELPGNAQYKFVSVNYEVDLEKFQAVGGRVKGTFSGDFTPDGGVTLVPFTDCSFDVRRNL